MQSSSHSDVVFLMSHNDLSILNYFPNFSYCRNSSTHSSSSDLTMGEFHFVLSSLSYSFVALLSRIRKNLLRFEWRHCREKSSRGRVTSLHLRNSLSCVVLLLHSIESFRRDRNIVVSRHHFLPRSELEHPQRFERVIHLLLPILTKMCQITAVCRFLDL